MKKEDSRELEEMKKMLIEQQAHIKAQQDKIRELAELAKKDDGKIRHEKFDTIVGLLE